MRPTVKLIFILIIVSANFAEAQKIIPASEAAAFYAAVPDSARALINNALPGEVYPPSEARGKLLMEYPCMCARSIISMSNMKPSVLHSA